MEKKNFEFFKEVEELKQNIEAAIFHLNAIEEEEDKNIVDLHISCLEELRDQIFKDPETVRKDIKSGKGDYIRIKDKCIRLGLV
jgi:hypothetical protein